MKGGFGFNHALRVRRGGENEVYDGYFCKGFGEKSLELSIILIRGKILQEYCYSETAK